jgi:heat shock protein HslJ
MKLRSGTWMLLLTVCAASFPASAGESAAPAPAPSLEGTYWRAAVIAGKTAPAQDPKREAHLVLGGGDASGSDGCNRISGRYKIEPGRVSFGQTTATQMACPDTGELERGFRAVLGAARRYRITGARLEIMDESGMLLAVFEARAKAPR